MKARSRSLSRRRFRLPLCSCTPLGVSQALHLTMPACLHWNANTMLPAALQRPESCFATHRHVHRHRTWWADLALRGGVLLILCCFIRPGRCAGIRALAWRPVVLVGALLAVAPAPLVLVVAMLALLRRPVKNAMPFNSQGRHFQLVVAHKLWLA